MRLLMAILALFGVLAGSLQAQELSSSKDLNKVSSGVYVLDKAHASVLFRINHLGFSNYHGRFDVLDATLNFDAKVPEMSKLEASIDLSSINTNNAKLQDELKSTKFFDVAQYPKATFRSLRTKRTGADTGTMIGELTLHGVTKPLTLEIRFHGGGIHPFTKKPVLGFAATGVIKRSEWGIKEYVPMVGDDVAIDIEAEFNASEGEAAAPAPVAKPSVPAPVAPQPPTPPALPLTQEHKK